jgi:co-chaperonin GroES (HSP10)
MKINNGFIAIEELDYDKLKKRFIIFKKHDGESRFAGVVAVSESSKLKVGDIILHEKGVMLYKAPDIGVGNFYIEEREINSKIEDGNIVSIKESVYIDADKNSKRSVDYDGLNIKIDHEYDEYRSDLVTNFGTVLSSPLYATNSYLKTNNELDIEISNGDKVYSHHFLTHEDNERLFNNKKVYEIRYEDCYCKVVDNKITMLNEWNFIEPIKDKAEDFKIGRFETKKTLANDSKKGIVKYLNKHLEKQGVKVGDTIFFKPDRDYKINVEGEELYRINTRDIVLKLNDKTMRALGERVLATPLPAEEKILGRFEIPEGNRIKPNIGKVVSVGAGIDDEIGVGELVLYEPGYGLTIIDEGVEYIVLEPRNIFAIK